MAARLEHVLWLGRLRVACGRRHDFEKPKQRLVILTTEVLSVYTDDTSSTAVQQAIKSQVPPESRPLSLFSVPVVAIRGFYIIGSDPLPAHPAGVPDTPSLSTITASKLVVFIDDAKLEAVWGSESGSKSNVIVLHVHDTTDPTVFAMCLAQMARRLKLDAQGLLQKKGALMMIWKKRYYVVTDSQDMLQLASNESEAAVTLHVPLWSSQVVVTLATHADIPTGCLGVVIKHAVEDVVASASPIGPAANSHTKPIVLACEKEDVPIWSSLWKPVFDDVMYPDRSDSTEVASKATAVSVFLAVLAANHSRYRILIRSDRLMEAVSRGIPPELRGEFWSVLCNVDGRKAVRGSSQLTGSKSLYERLSSRRPPPGSLWHFAMNHALQNTSVDSPLAVRRMLLAFNAWQLASPKVWQTLSHVGASSVSVHNRFHPSLVAITSSLLHHLKEEEAFWALTWMSDRLLPQYFATVHYIGLQIFSSVFAEQIAQLLPRIAGDLTAAGIPPKEFAKQFLPCCLSFLPPETTGRLWDFCMLNGHSMLFRLSLAVLHCWHVKFYTAARPVLTVDTITTEMRHLTIEDILSTAFHTQLLLDVEKDFATRRDAVCIQVLKEVDAVIKSCSARDDAIACIDQTAVEVVEVMDRLVAALPIRQPNPITHFADMLAIADGIEYASNPLVASVRVEFHANSLKESMQTLQQLCGTLHNAVQARIVTLQQCVQVSVSVSKAALAAQAQTKVPTPLHVDATDHPSTSGDGVTAGGNRTNVTMDEDSALPHGNWLTEVTAEVLGSPQEVDDSPALVLDCVSAVMWAVNALGFALVSVAKEVDFTLGSFAHTSGEDGPQCNLSRLCLSTLTEMHDFASKLCGLTASVVDTHSLHRFEQRPLLPILAPSEALKTFQSTAGSYKDRIRDVQAVVDRLERFMLP